MTLDNPDYFVVPVGMDTEKALLYFMLQGRRSVFAFDACHDLIVGPLKKESIVYRCECIKGSLTFPTREVSVNGVARSKISTCILSSVSDPRTPVAPSLI